MDEQRISQQYKANKSKMPIILGSCLGMAVLLAGVFFYLWMSQSSEVSRLKEVETSNRQKIESLQGQVSEIVSDNKADSEDKTDTATPDPETSNDGSTSSSDADETKSIIEMTSAHAHARVGSENAKLNIQIVKKQPSFARVSVMVEEGVGGYACVLKKSDNIWLVLFCGQGAPLQSELDQWGVPASIIQS